METDEEVEDLETEEDVVGLEEIEEVASVIVVGMIEEMVDVMVTVEEEVAVSEDEEAVAAVVHVITATMRDIWQETVPKETEEIEEDDRLILIGFFKNLII